jgi:CRP-like cAMP-binding protein
MDNFFWSNLFNRVSDETGVIADFWRATPLFRNIPLRHVQALAENMHVRHYQQDEWVFREGDQGAGAILVLEGRVRVVANQTTLAEFDAGDFFGEIALAENENRTADALCTEAGRLVYFLKQDLEEWIEVEPRLGAVFLVNLASTLAQRLHRANQLIAEKI